MATHIEQVYHIIRSAGNYKGAVYPSKRGINQVDEVLPKYYIAPIQNYDNSNTEQVKFFKVLFKCPSESEKETIESLMLGLTSDNILSGYNKTNNYTVKIPIREYTNDKSLTITTNIFSAEQIGEFAYLSNEDAFGYASYFKFLLGDLDISEFTIADARFYFYNVDNRTFDDKDNNGMVIYALYDGVMPSIDDDWTALNRTTETNSNPYFNENSSLTALVAGTQYYLGDATVASGTNNLSTIITAAINNANWDEESVIIEILSASSVEIIKAQTKDVSDSNTGKYAVLELDITPPIDFPFYIDIKQVPVELENRTVDYDPNNYYCQFQVEARWAI